MKATRKNKLSLSIKIAAILSCLAIVSVGFASWWIINYPGTKEFKTGSFTVYSVDEKNIEFSDITAVGSANVVFGKPASPNQTTKWLGTTKVDNESLTAVLKLDVTLTSKESDALNDYLKTIDVKYVGGAHDGLVSSNYLAAPVISYRVGGSDSDVTTGFTTASGTTFTIDAPDAKTATIYLKFEFKWGTVTENTNPYDYFNAQEQTDNNPVTNKTEKQTALDMLGAIAALKGNYEVHVSATKK